ncbi:MAG TPA: ADOP family duplicated permease [Gemmatimonadaceae bacterium]|nr:ADOP family duplicated permease [Gemmatimonadaceae bacterium]
MIRRGVRRAFRLAPRRESELVQQVDEEIRLHLELRAEQLERQGLSPEAARAEAVRRFGHLDTARHDLRRTAAHREQRMRVREQLESLWSDVRYAVRALRRTPGFTAVVVLTLALGIGANTAMFGVIDRLLLRGPAHVVDAERVRRVYLTGTPAPGQTGTGAIVPFATYTDLRDGTDVFAQLAALNPGAEERLGRGAGAELVRVRAVTWTLFPLLGVRPALGRFFGAAEDTPPRGTPVAVLDHGFWLDRFGGDSSIVGRTIALDGRTVTVIGVAPRGFTGVELRGPAVWVPMSTRPVADDWPTTRAIKWVQVIGRLKPGVTSERAGAAATVAHRRAYADIPSWEREGTLSLRPTRFDLRGEEPLELEVSRWLVGVAAVVLLVACANVTNLLLARALRRRREVAVRLALGIGRARLVRLLLAEGLLLALAGGVVGLLVAYMGGHLLRVTLLADVSWPGAPLDGRMLAVTAAVALLTGLVVALLPALQASRPRLAVALKEGAPQSGARSRLRGGLTVAQAALSVVLLVGAGLFVRSLWQLRHLDRGVDTTRVLQLRPSWPRLPENATEEQRTAERARQRQVRARALAAVAQLPGVAAAAIGTGSNPFYSTMGTSLRTDGRDSVPDLPGGGPYIAGVTSGYFATLGTHLQRGRDFTEADREGSAPVAIVNETLARTLWPGQDPLGRCLYRGGPEAPCLRVVGVVEDVLRQRLREEAAMQLYVPLEQGESFGPLLLVRAAGDPLRLVPALRRTLHQVDPTLAYVTITPLQQAVDEEVRPWRLGATLFGLFGGLALVVAAVGLYSVMAYSAAQRTHELGVRLALGARPGDLRRLLVRDGVALATFGVALGLLAALVAGRWVEPLLFDTSPREPAVLGGVTVALLAVAVLASVVPARRAARTPPSVALRAE